MNCSHKSWFQAKLDDEDKLLESDTEETEHNDGENLLISGDEGDKLQSSSEELVSCSVHSLVFRCYYNYGLTVDFE